MATWNAIPDPDFSLEGAGRRNTLEDRPAAVLFDEEQQNVPLAAESQAEKGPLRFQPLAATARDDGSAGRTAAAAGLENRIGLSPASTSAMISLKRIVYVPFRDDRRLRQASSADDSWA